MISFSTLPILGSSFLVIGQAGYVGSLVRRLAGVQRGLWASPAVCTTATAEGQTENEVVNPGQWQGAWDTHRESRGPPGIPSDNRNAEAVELPKWPFEPLQTSLPWAKSHPTAHQSLICPSGQVIYYGSETGLEKNNLL